ncbi:MAG TPA: hypothetical protein VHL60_05190 [Oxalicibacterium sp.]|jgi:hypothetical protein|nr:hypothetical protein [Oxalicibacterium sp.]
MQGYTSYFVDTALAKHAVQLCLPTIEASMNSREAGASGFLYIVIMRPGFTPAHGSFAEAILYEHAVGDPAKWDADYAKFARGKAELSWRTGMDTHIVQQHKPHLLTEGDSLLWGGVVLHDFIVAVSGADPWFDEAFAGSIVMFLRALTKKAVGEQAGKPWLGAAA